MFQILPLMLTFPWPGPTALCRIICSKAVTAYYERRKRNKYGESVTVGRSASVFIPIFDVKKQFEGNEKSQQKPDAEHII